ncbi:MAG: PIN domain-containing protein [Verrucomicrobiota bacterium]
MIAFDTNVLFPSLEETHPDHAAARRFLGDLQTGSQSVALCELTLVETYVLLRNPAICRNPLDHQRALEIINHLRTNSSWRLVDYPGGLMDRIWKNPFSDENPPRRRIFDTRLAVTLLHNGVTHFATANTKDFVSFPFDKLWNPFLEQ